jgi:hypothetical protein
VVVAVLNALFQVQAGYEEVQTMDYDQGPYEKVTLPVLDFLIMVLYRT